MEHFGVYCIKNKVNGRKYIGSSINIKKRFYEHKRLLKTNKHFNKYLQNAWIKYGEENFSFYIIENLIIRDDKFLRKREKKQIINNKAMCDERGYNLSESTFYPSQKTRPVYKFDMKGVLVCKYDSIKEAWIDNPDKSAASIRNCCIKIINYSHKHTYRYCSDFSQGEVISIKPTKYDNRSIEDGIYKNDRKYSINHMNVKDFIILCYDLKGKFLNHYKNTKVASESLGVNKQSLTNRLKDNNRLINSNKLRLRTCSNYIFLRHPKSKNIPLNIETKIKFLQKINPNSNAVEKEYDINGRHICSKENNITPYNLDRYIKRGKALNGFLYTYKTY